MALINLIRIDDRSGVLLADEEFWRRGTRRTLSLDNLQSLLPPEFCESTGMEAVIGIEGDPSVTHEAVLNVQKQLKRTVSDPASEGRKDPIRSLKEIAQIAIREIDGLIRKRINDQLGFVYGFTVDDLNRGYFERDGERIEIKQEMIRSDALKWLKYDDKSAHTRSLFEISALIAGVDSRNGFHWYEWSGKAGNMFLGSGLFESIGKGSDAANLAFIDFFRNRGLKERRKGIKQEEALLALITALEAATRFNHEVGGYPQFVLITGEGKTHVQRYREYTGHGAKLAQEIVTAWVHGFIGKPAAMKLVKNLVLDDIDLDRVEAEFLKSTQNHREMEHFLRGYKSRIQAEEARR
ncbi:hypothetical protein JXA40_12595 [bacterium]|nr:hypothetical protein [candidate division CSSED10-310 bacterium]